MQVALLVAAEFWEQGDLERTVLQQNPIVSSGGGWGRNGGGANVSLMLRVCDLILIGRRDP